MFIQVQDDLLIISCLLSSSRWSLLGEQVTVEEGCLLSVSFQNKMNHLKDKREISMPNVHANLPQNYVSCKIRSQQIAQWSPTGVISG